MKQQQEEHNNNNNTEDAGDSTVQIDIKLELSKKELEKVLLRRAGVEETEKVSMRELVKETVGKMSEESKGRVLMGKPTMGRTLDVDEMRPTKYQPKASRHFVAKVMGIDAYLVKSFERGEWSRKGSKKRMLAVEIYDPTAPSGEQQVREWLDAQTFSGRMKLKREYKKALEKSGKKLDKNTDSYWKLCCTPYRGMVLEYLDPVGTVISEVEYTGLRLERVEFSELNYDFGKGETKFVTLRLEMSYKEELFKF